MLKIKCLCVPDLLRGWQSTVCNLDLLGPTAQISGKENEKLANQPESAEDPRHGDHDALLEDGSTMIVNS
jgi:hypothetical protein